MIAPLKIPRLLQNVPLVELDRTSTLTMTRWWNTMAEQTEAAVNGILQLPEIQAAIDAANMAAAAANLAATNAQAAADAAQSTADSNAFQQALINSYITPDSVLTGTASLITVAAHTRHYGDGTSVAVSGGTVAPLGLGDNYVFYSDPTHAGGVVTYLVSATPVPQTGSNHNVGAITIPGSGSASGGNGPQQPGGVTP